MNGVQETQEVLVAVMKLAKALIKTTKDGVDLSDFAELMANEEVKAALAQAWGNIKQVPVEVKDISLAEGFELGMIVLKEVPGIIEELKK